MRASRRTVAHQLRYASIDLMAFPCSSGWTSLPDASNLFQGLAKLTVFRSVTARSELSTQWKADLDDRIARLTRLRDQLSGCIGCGCLSITDCPLRNPYDELGEAGPGPRLLDPA